MGLISLCGKWAWVIIFFSQISLAGAEEIFIVDFDDTLVESRGAFRGNFVTPIRLFRIHDRSTTLEALPEGPEVIEVNGAELYEIKHRLAKGPGKTGDLLKTYRLSTGLEIYPGFYEFRWVDSLVYFDRSRNEHGQNFLIDSFATAEAEGEGWKGLYWDAFAELLSDQERARRVAIVTSRGHDRQDWIEFFSHLQEKGYIRYTPRPEMIHPLGRSEYEPLGPRTDMATRKLNQIEKIVRSLSQIALKEGETAHRVVIAENDGRTMDLIYQRMAELVRRRAYGQLEIYFVHTGYDWEVQESQRPRVSVMTESGAVRELSAVERRTKWLRVDSRRLQSCRANISRLPRP